MSIASFVQAYIKPSRWWRRRKSIEVTIWPRFLAQALCPHLHKQPWMWDNAFKTTTSKCLDCHKDIIETNDCAHGEVSPSMTEFRSEKMTPRTFQCEGCGAQLEPKDLPKDVKIVPATLTSTPQSAARDH